ncbi:hemerythrin domain-containing protein [Paraburkholderia sp. J41]|uniref:hemerythrin domain-containing protein n=1 Tax=Paraburkholderia sp. J41 TaxID=2805433 RepID=UPI002AC36C54|nr:hemerythrin domain-containing protein [Paraburkholderia sp. J41]
MSSLTAPLVSLPASLPSSLPTSLLPAELQLGEPVTDATHTEFLYLLDRARDATDDALVGALDAWIAHTREHFAQEERWMDATEFGPRHCHAGQHRHVLQVAALVRAEIADHGRFDLGRRLIGEVRDWFAHHVLTMDSMMISHMREAGVAPVA